MTSRRRIMTATVLALTTALGLSACSQGGAGSLTFMVFETPALDAKFWDTSIATAAKEVSGAAIKKIVSPDADRTKYAKQLQASGQFPDILASISPKDFAGAKLLKPFDQKWLDDNFLQPTANAIGGETYIPPTNSQIIPLVFYNKKIFADNGISVPTTWAAFTAAITKLRAAGITPLELAGSETWAASMPLVGLASADVLGKDPAWIQKLYKGEAKLSDPLFANAMQKAVNLVKMGAYNPAALSVDFKTANSNFLAGKSAMYPMGSWFTGSSYITAAQADNIGVFPWPTDDGSVVIPFNVGGTTSVSATSKNVDAAQKFAQAWSLAPANLKVLIETDGAFPMMKKLSIKDFGATVSSLYNSSYSYVTNSNTKVSSFGWVNNDDALAPGINDSFYALAQSVFSDSDVKKQLTKLDADWAAATKK